MHHVITDRLSDFNLDEKGAQALWGQGGGCDTLALQLSGSPAGWLLARGRAEAKPEGLPLAREGGRQDCTLPESTST